MVEVRTVLVVGKFVGRAAVLLELEHIEDTRNFEDDAESAVKDLSR